MYEVQKNQQDKNHETYRKSEFLILLVKSRPKRTPSSIQNIGRITLGIFFMISTSGIGFTSRDNCMRFAADNGLPVNYPMANIHGNNGLN